jgi:hypothetical protein
MSDRGNEPEPGPSRGRGGRGPRAPPRRQRGPGRGQGPRRADRLDPTEAEGVGVPLPPDLEEAEGGVDPPPDPEEEELPGGDPEEGDNDPRMAINANQLVLLGEFKGEAAEDIELFSMQVRRCRETFAWTQAQTSQLVQTRLKGSAGTWLRSKHKTTLPADHMEVWEHVEDNHVMPDTGLRHHLLQRFREPINVQAAVDAVADLKQKSSESVEEFYDRTVLAMDRKNHRATEHTKSTAVYKEKLIDDVFTFFAAGMREDLRMAAMGGPNPPLTADTLLTAARNAEKQKQKMKTPKFLTELQEEEASQPSTSNAAAATSQEEGLALQLQELRHELEAMKAQSGPGAQRDVECYKCGRRGHYSFNCPTLNKTSNGRGRGGGRRGAPSGGRLLQVRRRPQPQRSGSRVVGRGGRLYMLENSAPEVEEDYELEEVDAEDEEFYWSPN